MTTDAGNLALTKDALIPLLRQMLLIRRMEERLSADFQAGKLPGAAQTARHAACLLVSRRTAIGSQVVMA